MSTIKLKTTKIAQNGTQSVVLKAVRDNMPISRTGIFEKTALPHAAISRTVAVLIENECLIEESLADTNGPRRKRGIRLNPNKGYCIAIEYGPNHMEAIVLDSAYAKTAEYKIGINLKTLPQDEKISHIVNFTRNFKERVKLSEKICLGIALIDPGVIDIDNRVSICCSTLDHWQNVSLADIVEREFLIPVKLINTSLAKICAVDRVEVSGNPDNLIYIEYGEGIGCGIKLAGKYITGRHNLAGELGHVRITDKPTSCTCGGVGCLESLAALPAIVANAKAAIQASTSSILNSVENIDGLAVLHAAAMGDRLALHIVDDAFDYLGRAVAGIVNIVNPEMIVFDNIIGQAGESAIATLMRSLQKNTLSAHWNDLKLHISSIASFIGPIGGAASILDECMDC